MYMTWLISVNLTLYICKIYEKVKSTLYKLKVKYLCIGLVTARFWANKRSFSGVKTNMVIKVCDLRTKQDKNSKTFFYKHVGYIYILSLYFW